MVSEIRRTASVIVAASVAMALTVAPTAAPAFGASVTQRSGPEAAPRTPRITERDVAPAAAARAGRVRGETTVAALPGRSTEAFSMVGVTWRDDDELGEVAVRVRTHSAEGWTAWQDLAVDDHDHDGSAAEPSTGERGGTEPAFVGSSDGVAVDVRASGGAVPRDVQVETIRLDDAPTTAAAPAALPDPSPVFPRRPDIISRSAWKASAGSSCDAPRVGRSTFGVTLHHTAGSNSYTRSQSASIVRGIQAYHTKSRGWCDIGYNMLVDKYGQIFEGRKGGVDRTVRGAHAGNSGVNTYAMGVAMLGNYDSASVSSATSDALVQLIGWRLGTFYRPSGGTWSTGGDTFRTVHGHRDVVSTACPGAKGYAWLPTLRSRLASYLADVDTPIKRYAATLGRDYIGYPYIGESGNATVRKTYFQNMEIYWKKDVGAFDVGGHYRIAYNALKAEKGVLGHPTATRVASGTTGVSLQRFENGTVYRVTRGTATAGHALFGAIAQTYVDEGEAGGRLGRPLSGIETVTGGTRARFDGGTITQRGSDAPVVSYR